MILKFLSRTEIDTQLWDRKINDSKNGIIYAYSWHLDILTENWEGLVSPDYKFIMPIPFKKKFGIKYIYNPFLTKQSGIFSAYTVGNEIIEDFLKKIFAKYKYIDINVDFEVFDLKLKTGINYSLNLSKSYNEHYQNFCKNTKRNIQKAEKISNYSEENISIKQFIDFYKKEKQFVTNADNDIRTEQYIDYCDKNKHSEIIGIFNDKKQLVSAAFFSLSPGRIYYSLGVSGEEGKKTGASYKIFDFIIKKYSGKNCILDFEGSNIPGIARFFAGWGAKPELYYNLKHNNLFFPLSLLKK